MPFKNENIAIRRHENIVRLKAQIGLARAAGFAQRQEQFPIAAEFENLVPLGCWCGRSRSTCSITAGPGAARTTAVGYPDVVVAVDKDAVRGNHHAAAKAFDQFPG